ncbi:12276_t:CDS:2, partial [Dentiscutata erythropus]
EDIFAESNEFDKESGKELDEEAMTAPTIIWEKDKKENARITKINDCELPRRLSIPSMFPMFPMTFWA